MEKDRKVPSKMLETSTRRRADLSTLIPDPMPAWLRRAMDPSTPMTARNETVRSTSYYSKQHGGELIVPTIRLGSDGKLYKPKDPLGEAIRAGDYIVVPGPAGKATADKATTLSKYISDTLINNARKPGKLLD